MPKPYPHEERKKTRALIKRLDDLGAQVEAMARGKTAYNAKMIAGVTALAETPDLEGQVKALRQMSEARRKQHENHLVELGRDDLTAFAELISPHEPPPPHLIYVSERLMEIEGGDRDRLILSMPPGHAKDLDVETPVMMGDGSWKRLGDVEVGDMVITMHGRPREVLAVHDQGVRPVFKLVTESGRTVRPHPDHLFLTPHDWTRAKDLSAGMCLAVPKNFEIPGAESRSRDEFALAGFMMARAVVAGRTYSRLPLITDKFRCDDSGVLAEFTAIAERMNFFPRQKRNVNYGQEAVYVSLHGHARAWLEDAGLWRAHKTTARVPDWVFTGTHERIAAFLGAILSCDASFRPVANKHTGNTRVVQVMINENPALARDLQRLFLRVGVDAEFVSTHSFYNYDIKARFKLVFKTARAQAALSRNIPFFGASKRLWDLPLVASGFTHPEFHDDWVKSIEPDGLCETRCLTVEEDHSFLADGLVVHNSTYGSRYYPAWYLGRKENRIYLQAGHSKDFAQKEFGRKTKDIITGDAFRKVFPDVGLRFDATAAADWMLTNGNRYVAKGVGEGISGFRSTNNAIDDPYKDFASAQSPVTRKKVWEWFVNDFMTRLLPQGNAFIITTRWHMDDVVGRLTEMMESGEIEQPWDFINLPVFSVSDEDQMCRKIGEPLWPDFYTSATLLRQKALMTTSQWSALYEGNPMPLEGNTIKSSWLVSRYILPPRERYSGITSGASDVINNEVGDLPEIKKDASGTLTNSNVLPYLYNENEKDQSDLDNTEPLGASVRDNLSKPAVHSSEQGQLRRLIANPPQFIRTVLSCDSAEKETARADFSAITVWRECVDRKHYIVDGHRERMEFPKLLERIDQFASLWDVEIVLMEEKGAGNQYIQHCAALPPHEQKPFVIVPINPGRDGKVFRMDAVTPFFMQNRVILPERATWLGAFEREILEFPGSKNDDYADTVSQYLKWARDTGQTRRGTKKLR